MEKIPAVAPRLQPNVSSSATLKTPKEEWMPRENPRTTKARDATNQGVGEKRMRKTLPSLAERRKRHKKQSASAEKKLCVAAGIQITASGRKISRRGLYCGPCKIVVSPTR